MSQQDEAVSELTNAGVLRGIRWAWLSARRRVWDDYDPATGHDQGWLGYTAHGIFRDRLDRVFACDRFGVAPDAEPLVGLDVLSDGLAQEELESMPRLDPAVVERADLNGSPGWRYGRWQWLLQSFPYGTSDHISWSQTSDTKRQVATQPNPDQGRLWDDLSAVTGQADEQQEDPAGPVEALIAAHSIDPETGAPELFIGRSRLNHGGGYPWYWKVDLLAGSSGGGGRESDLRAKPSEPTPKPVPDASVRLRPKTNRGGDSGAGEQQ